MLQVRLIVIAALFVALSVSDQSIQLTQFGHNGVGYRVVETVEPVRRKRDTTTTNTTSSSIFECYQYTWAGVSENNTVPDCTKVRKTSPCYAPFVFTNDTSSPIPDPAIVKQHCDKMGCKVTCPKTTTNTCIRYAYYTGGQPQNITYFCGAVQDTTDDVTLKEGFVTDTLTGGLIIKTKYCQGNLCNAGNLINVPFVLMLVSFVALFLLR